jgi:hypothetical protein
MDFVLNLDNKYSTHLLLHINEKVQKRFIRLLYNKSFGPIQYPGFSKRWPDLPVPTEIQSRFEAMCPVVPKIFLGTPIGPVLALLE